VSRPDHEDASGHCVGQGPLAFVSVDVRDFNPSVNTNTLRPTVALVWTMIRAAGWRVPAALGLMMLAAATGGLMVLALAPLSTALGGPATGLPTGGWLGLASWLAGSPPVLWRALATFVFATSAQASLIWLERTMSARVIQDVVVGLRTRLADHLFRADWVWFSGTRRSDLVHTFVRDVDRTAQGAYDVLVLAAGVCGAVVYVLIAASVSRVVTAVVLVEGVVAWVVLTRQRRAVAALGEDLTTRERELSRSISESIDGMKVIRAYGRRDQHHRSIVDLTSAVGDRAARLMAGHAGAKLALDVSAVVLVSLTIWVAVSWIKLPPVSVLVLLAAFLRLAPQLSAIQLHTHALSAELPAFAAVRDLEKSAAAAIQPEVPARPLPFSRELRVEQVSFKYESELVLEDVSFTVPAGGSVAIVGASGAGKSTIVDLVLGLVPPATGCILVDGVPLGPDGAAAWQQQVGVVLQDSPLFHDTVRANLLWAKPDAADTELFAALQDAAATFVHQLPNGLDTVVGDNGARLSGGERQRVALARALLRRPRLLILDEATSALDAANEEIVRTAIARLRGRVAMLLITHRSAVLRDVDTTLVLDRGRLVGQQAPALETVHGA